MVKVFGAQSRRDTTPSFHQLAADQFSIRSPLYVRYRDDERRCMQRNHIRAILDLHDIRVRECGRTSLTHKPNPNVVNRDFTQGLPNEANEQNYQRNSQDIVDSQQVTKFIVLQYHGKTPQKSKHRSSIGQLPNAIPHQLPQPHAKLDRLMLRIQIHPLPVHDSSHDAILSNRSLSSQRTMFPCFPNDYSSSLSPPIAPMPPILPMPPIPPHSPKPITTDWTFRSPIWFSLRVARLGARCGALGQQASPCIPCPY